MTGLTRRRYYNGTVRFTLNLRNDTESTMPNEACSGFINDRIQIEWNALLTIAKPDPKDDNPGLFTMQAWDKGFDLLGEYSEYQHSSSHSILYVPVPPPPPFLSLLSLLLPQGLTADR